MSPQDLGNSRDSTLIENVMGIKNYRVMAIFNSFVFFER